MDAEQISPKIRKFDAEDVKVVNMYSSNLTETVQCLSYFVNALVYDFWIQWEKGHNEAKLILSHFIQVVQGHQF
jgi:hypothetical protein